MCVSARAVLVRDDTIQPYVLRLRAALSKLHERTRVFVLRCFGENMTLALEYHASPVFTATMNEKTCTKRGSPRKVDEHCLDGTLAYSPKQRPGSHKKRSGGKSTGEQGAISSIKGNLRLARQALHDLDHQFTASRERIRDLEAQIKLLKQKLNRSYDILDDRLTRLEQKNRAHPS